MADFGGLLQEYVNMDYSELLAFAKNAMSKILPVFSELVGKENAAITAMAVVFAALSADNKLSNLECQLFRDIIGSDMTNQEIFDSVNSVATVENDKFVYELCDACPTEIRAELVNLSLCFVAVDETISREETAFIRKLMS